VDYNKKLPESRIYDDLNAEEFLRLAYKRLKNVGDLIS
jgi:hypothetical protein